MFKPHTVEQFKVMQYIEEVFHKGSVVVSPDSRTALKVTDSLGDYLVFDYLNGRVVEAEKRPIPSPEECAVYIKKLKAEPGHPSFTCLEDIVRWWHQEDRPISFQQALNLPDDLFQYYLRHEIIDTDEVRRLVSLGRITEEQYLAVMLWYKNGNFIKNWLGCVGVDGTGDAYELALDYQTLTERRFRFYLMNEYYRTMNGQQ
ncbi:MAG: hypothetical protein RR461_03050 [Angelakisella sp.]